MKRTFVSRKCGEKSQKESKCQFSHNDCYENWDFKNERQNHACHVVGVPASKKTAEKGLKNLEKYHAKTGKVGEAGKQYWKIGESWDSEEHLG
ncbi:hypothetical protein WISP_118223 [Willisornis vidua]|uniref:Uncharacterized protein n=1 Tax=Willisornis vidua TaxID=1566151 RepID=A0ABQ9CT87_9PASS|nr:hypothetical protein WISP_118223 [Willisornis vidua]